MRSREASPLTPRYSITTVRIKMFISASFFLIHMVLFKLSCNFVHRGYKENFRVVRKFKDGSLNSPHFFLVRKRVATEDNGMHSWAVAELGLVSRCSVP